MWTCTAAFRQLTMQLWYRGELALSPVRSDDGGEVVIDRGCTVTMPVNIAFVSTSSGEFASAGKMARRNR